MKIVYLFHTCVVRCLGNSESQGRFMLTIQGGHKDNIISKTKHVFKNLRMLVCLFLYFPVI